MLGGRNVLCFLVDEPVWRMGARGAAPLKPTIAAGSAIGLWAAVLFCGHMLPVSGSGVLR